MKNTHVGVGLVACIICSCVSHKKAPLSMIDGIAKSRPEIELLMESANGGNAKDALSLAYHYLLVECNNEKATHWFRVAAEVGGTQEKEIDRSFLAPE